MVDSVAAFTIQQDNQHEAKWIFYYFRYFSSCVYGEKIQNSIPSRIDMLINDNAIRKVCVYVNIETEVQYAATLISPCNFEISIKLVVTL